MANTNDPKKVPPSGHPKQAAKWGAQKGTEDAFCTECETWYDSTDQKAVDRHAH